MIYNSISSFIVFHNGEIFWRSGNIMFHPQLIRYTETLSEVIACNTFDICKWLVNYDINDGSNIC